nr:helix-turn-helix transcriptional regulator [Microbacterium azadirachtae]
MLRMARLEKGASQEQLALDAGITVYTYGGLERGHTPRGDEVNPTFDTVMRILHALDIEVEFKPRCADGL